MKFFLNNIYNNKRWLLIFIFLISLLASFLFLIFLGNLGPSEHATPGNDYASFYEPVANSILQGKGIAIKGELDLRYPPGYPIILAIIFAAAKLLAISQLGLITAFNVIAAALSACFLFLIAETIFGSRVGLIASFLWLSYPFNLWFLKNPNTEAPFIFLLYAAIWLCLLAVKEKRLGAIFLSGAVFGLASLIRPIGLFLPFFLALLIFFLLKEKSKKLCLLLASVLLLGNIAAILPWETHVFLTAGRVVSLSDSGPTAILDGLTFAVKPGEGSDQVVVSADVRELMGRVDRQELNSGAKILNFMAGELVSRPVAFLKLTGWKLARSWYATSQMWWEGKILMLQLVYLIPGLLGMAYLFRKQKDKIYGVVFLLGVIIYFWLMTFLALSILRYMVPAMGLIMIFSAITVDSLWKKMFR